VGVVCLTSKINQKSHEKHSFFSFSNGMSANIKANVKTHEEVCSYSFTGVQRVDKFSVDLRLDWSFAQMSLRVKMLLNIAFSML